MATTRLDIRLDEKIKAKAERATALLGLKSLTEYITVLMDKNATQVISEHMQAGISKTMVLPALYTRRLCEGTDLRKLTLFLNKYR